MHVLSVVGARPQFVKLAPIAEALTKAEHSHTILHTGQHYDEALSESFFQELHIPPPDFNLNIGSLPHPKQTARVMAGVAEFLETKHFDWMLVYGDTNSTLGAAVCAAKMGVPLAHLEAGLRSNNRQMPEEINRILTDHASDLLLAPTETALAHLRREGLEQRSSLIGDVMLDVLKNTEARVLKNPPTLPFSTMNSFILATIHRPANTDKPDRLASILDALESLDQRVVLTAHPRLITRSQTLGMNLPSRNIEVVPPLSYPQMVLALNEAQSVITDSGGLQKEAYMMSVLTTTLRSETEWPETIQGGWNVLINNPEQLRKAVSRALPAAPPVAHYGSGKAAETAVSLMENGRDR